MSKTISPYTRLLNDAKNFIYKIHNPSRIFMWRYPKDKLGERWTLTDLYERTKAAEQLGYDVIVIAEDNGLTIQYRKMMPEIPYNFKY